MPGGCLNDKSVFPSLLKQDYGAPRGGFGADDDFLQLHLCRVVLFLFVFGCNIHTNQNNLLTIYLSLLTFYDCINGSYHSLKKNNKKKKTQDTLQSGLSPLVASICFRYSYCFGKRPLLCCHKKKKSQTPSVNSLPFLTFTESRKKNLKKTAGKIFG